MFDFRQQRPSASIASEDPYLTLARLPTPAETLRLIRRQELLRQRGRPPFAVVVVAVGRPADDPAPALRVLNHYLQRARAGDEIGWIAADRLALILPLTSRDGALRLAEEVAARAGLAGAAPAFDVYTP